MLIIIFFILLFVTALLYHTTFRRRFEADDKPLGLTLDEFPLLTAIPVTFQSGKDTLHGYFYKVDQKTPVTNALLIICHGMSNGSRDYLSHIYYFANHGIEVLAYDNTGCHNSTGKGIRGLPQAVINLQDVIKQLSELPGLKEYHKKQILLFGHSWGGYACSCILNTVYHKRIRAVICLSAPDKSLPILIEQGRHMTGKIIFLLKPFLFFLERLRFGSLAALSGMNGINHSQAFVLACHSLDDPVVSYHNSIVYKQAQCTNSHAIFITYSDRGHNIALSNDSKKYGACLRNVIASKKISKSCLASIFAQCDKKRLYQLDEKTMSAYFDFYMNSLLD